jgi:hypothetical protein
MAKRDDSPSINNHNNQKMFIKAQVDLNVALGQLLKVRHTGACHVTSNIE